MLKITEFKTEYQLNPLGLDVKQPRFSWIMDSNKNDTVQTKYSITVKHDNRDDEIVWETGEITSDISTFVEYSGAELKSRTRYTVSLTINDNHGEIAAADTWFETGLMGDNAASWITHGYEDDIKPCPIYVKGFDLSEKIKSARIYASALGVYDIEINGQKAGDTFFAPGWTSYKTRVQYQTYDITDLITGSNRIEITSANGWYKGEFGFICVPDNYGSRTAIWAQIEITYEDGRVEKIYTDESWQYGTGPRRYSEIYHGEIIDKNFPVKTDGNASIFDHPVSCLISQECEPVRITKRLKPVERIKTPKGEIVFDFGQNLTGVVEARHNCPKNTEITIKHAEVLDREGNFYTENLRNARATDTFICAGGGEETFLPLFTFHGFRYIQVEGLGDDPDPEWFTACVLHTDMEQLGTFECSHPPVNRLQQNIEWGQRGNFLDIPTDCPQRDERLGWTGDAQIFASTAAYNFDTGLFFTKWMRDV